MEIRKTKESDVSEIKKIYDRARKYMKEHGNSTQWSDGYPSEEVIRTDMANGNSYVMEENGKLYGVFVFIIGEEPTYQVIEHGNWHADRSYGTIHRIASAGLMKGVTRICFDYCARQVDYLRIDTHKNNKSMQAAIKAYGFSYCGQIYVRNGERLAFDYLPDVK